MKKRILIITTIAMLSTASMMLPVFAESADQQTGYRSVSQEEAHELMQDNKDVLILDVRTSEEYEEGHIANAVLLPLDEVEERCNQVLTDKEQTILVYCRSGRRSKLASVILAEQGYTDIVEFGGIIDWEYETETGLYTEMESETDNLLDLKCETESEICHHEWMEDCVSKTCSICGEYQRVAQ